MASRYMGVTASEYLAYKLNVLNRNRFFKANGRPRAFCVGTITQRGRHAIVIVIINDLFNSQIHFKTWIWFNCQKFRSISKMPTAGICMMDIFSAKRTDNLEKLCSDKLTEDLYRPFPVVSFSILKLFEFKTFFIASAYGFHLRNLNSNSNYSSGNSAIMPSIKHIKIINSSLFCLMPIFELFFVCSTLRPVTNGFLNEQFSA